MNMATGGARYKQGIVAESRPGFARVRFDDVDGLVTAWLPLLLPKTLAPKVVWALGVLCLAIFGWLSAISSLLQYTLIQTQTPEGMLGRINGLWTAQNVTGDAIGAATLGGLGAMMTPVASASSSGFALAVVGGILLLVLAVLRRFRQEVVLNDSAA